MRFWTTSMRIILYIVLFYVLISPAPAETIRGKKSLVICDAPDELKNLKFKVNIISDAFDRKAVSTWEKIYGTLKEDIQKTEDTELIVGLDVSCVIIWSDITNTINYAFIIHNDMETIAVYKIDSWDSGHKLLKLGNTYSYIKNDHLKDFLVPILRKHRPEALKGYDRFYR